MYLLSIIATTTEQHPEHDVIGDGFVSCWIERDNIIEAIETAHTMIIADHWDILRTKEVRLVVDADFEEDDEQRQYFEQALIDREVLVYFVCPRFPVYYLHFKLKPSANVPSPNEVRAWVSNECVFDGHDPMKQDFWSGDRVKRAISMATDAIEEDGYTVDELIAQNPCSRDSTSEEGQYYDDAEEDGLCLVFVHDEPESTST